HPLRLARRPPQPRADGHGAGRLHRPPVPRRLVGAATDRPGGSAIRHLPAAGLRARRVQPLRRRWPGPGRGRRRVHVVRDRGSRRLPGPARRPRLPPSVRAQLVMSSSAKEPGDVLVAELDWRTVLVVLGGLTVLAGIAAIATAAPMATTLVVIALFF